MNPPAQPQILSQGAKPSHLGPITRQNQINITDTRSRVSPDKLGKTLLRHHPSYPKEVRNRMHPTWAGLKSLKPDTIVHYHAPPAKRLTKKHLQIAQGRG
jgi:hypothetical protein